MTKAMEDGHFESLDMNQIDKINANEKYSESPASTHLSPQESKNARALYLGKILAIFVAATAYFISSLIITPKESLIRILLYLFIVTKLVVSIYDFNGFVSSIKRFWRPVNKFHANISKRVKGIIGIVITLIIILSVTFGAPVTSNGTIIQRSQSLLGLFVLIGIMIITSQKIQRINWHAVITGIIFQVLLGIFIFKTQFGVDLFQWISDRFMSIIQFASQGSKFVFGDMAATENFAFQVLPAILFFASFIEVLYYIGAMQWLIIKFAWFFKFFMNISGCESVVAAASPFLGQCESPLLVKPFVPDMTSAELHQVMTSGASTIAGSVMVAYLNLGINPQALITSCVMSIPCSLALSKLRYPELEESKIIDTVEIAQRDEKPTNVLHAATNGAIQGVHLCLIISGILLSVISLMALLDSILGWLGGYLGFHELTFKIITGYLFQPFAWLIGVPWQETKTVGQIMAVKMFVNEFTAFIVLSKEETKILLSSRTQILTTFALCGFANFSSMGLQIGILGVMAPERKVAISQVAFSAMLTGTMCTFISATIAGLLI